MAFLYTINKHTEKDIMNIFPFIIASEKINYLRTNVTKALTKPL